MSLTAIRRALVEARATRLSSEHPLWELSAPWWPFSRRARRYEAVLVEILELAVGLPGPVYLVIDENPQEYEVGGSWAHAQARTWAVPDACNLVALQQRVLSPGGWTLYCRSEPVEPGRIPDVFQVPPPETADFAIACGVPLLVQAFHANDPWRLWVEDVSSQREEAA